MLKRLPILLSILLSFCATIQTKPLIIKSPVDPSRLDVTISLQTFHALSDPENVDSYAEVYLDSKKIGLTEQRLLSQSKTFSFRTTKEKHTLKLKVFLQDRFKKRWTLLRTKQQPPLFHFPSTQESQLFIGISHSVPSHQYQFEYNSYDKTLGQNPDTLQEIPISLEIIPDKITSFHNINAYVEIFLDNALLIKTPPQSLAIPFAFNFSTSSQRHQLKLVWHLWSEEKQRFIRIRNLYQPPARSFTPHPDKLQQNFPLKVFFLISAPGTFSYTFNDNLYE